MDKQCINIADHFIHRTHTVHEPLVHWVSGQLLQFKLLFLKAFIVLSTRSRALNNNNKTMISNIY